MKIVIDSNKARISNLGKPYLIPKIDAIGVWVSIQIEQQKKSRWCWAAIATAVGAYYKSSDIDQEELVNILLKDIESKKEDYSQKDLKEKNINFKLDIALKHVKSFSHWTPGKPVFDRIQYEINQGRPFAVRLEWYKGGAHYILIKGYTPEQKELLIEDPLHGSTILPYEGFPGNYKFSGAVWTETFWTNKN